MFNVSIHIFRNFSEGRLVYQKSHFSLDFVIPNLFRNHSREGVIDPEINSG